MLLKRNAEDEVAGDGGDGFAEFDDDLEAQRHRCSRWS
jgi:hypothetical protein